MILQVKKDLYCLFRINNEKDHLVFFIHGMGQQYEKYGNIKRHGLCIFLT